MLTAAMQIAFLSGDTTKELLGYDLAKPADRAAYIEKLVAVILNNNEQGGF